MSKGITKAAIQARIDELQAAEQDAAIRLAAIRTAIAELRALLQPAAPVLSGEPLGEPQE